MAHWPRIAIGVPTHSSGNSPALPLTGLASRWQLAVTSPRVGASSVVEALACCSQSSVGSEAGPLGRQAETRES